MALQEDDDDDPALDTGVDASQEVHSVDPGLSLKVPHWSVNVVPRLLASSEQYSQDKSDKTFDQFRFGTIPPSTTYSSPAPLDPGTSQLDTIGNSMYLDLGMFQPGRWSMRSSLRYLSSREGIGYMIHRTGMSSQRDRIDSRPSQLAIPCRPDTGCIDRLRKNMCSGRHQEMTKLIL